jgi:hypothetical protein
MSTDTPISFYLLRKGSKSNVSYLHLGTGKWTLIGLKSTMWRKPPDDLGSSLLAETHGVGCGIWRTAPSIIIFGSSTFSQYAYSSVVQDGLWLWKGGGVERSGRVIPLLIHCNNRVDAPVFAQKFRWLRTTDYRPCGLQAPTGAV